MALNGEGEPQPTLLQVATQAAMVELFTQWQTYRNGVHMDWDTFRSINFRAIAVAVLTGAGFEVKVVDATLQLPTLGDDLNATVHPKVTQPSVLHAAARDARVQAIIDELDGKAPVIMGQGVHARTPEQQRVDGGVTHVGLATVRPEVTLAGTTTRRDTGVTKVTEEWGAPAQAYGLPAEVIAEHGKQVQG